MFINIESIEIFYYEHFSFPLLNKRSHRVFVKENETV